VIHDDLARELAAGAVLDDLAPDELAAYEAHRVTCAECRIVELELDHVLADLALVVPERVPPADLLGGIRRALAAEVAASVPSAGSTTATATATGASLAPIPSPRPVALPTRAPVPVGTPVASAPSDVVPLRRHSRGPLLASIALAAGLGVVALGLGARSLTLQQDLDAANAQVATLEGRIASQADTMNDAMTVAMNPAHLTAALHAEPLAPAAEAAVVYLPGAAESWIVARNLPPTPAGQGYQLWYADGAGVHPLQTVSFDGSGTFVARLGVDLAHSAAVMITLEPAGGATGEPGPQVVFGEL
jgi:hypothetical protein